MYTKKAVIFEGTSVFLLSEQSATGGVCIYRKDKSGQTRYMYAHPVGKGTGRWSLLAITNPEGGKGKQPDQSESEMKVMNIFFEE
jgi:hypothetical protein